MRREAEADILDGPTFYRDISSFEFVDRYCRFSAHSFAAVAFEHGIDAVTVFNHLFHSGAAGSANEVARIVSDAYGFSLPDLYDLMQGECHEAEVY